MKLVVFDIFSEIYLDFLILDVIILTNPTVSSLMDCLSDLSNNSIQCGISMCPSMIRKLKLIADFRKVLLLSKFKSVFDIFSEIYLDFLILDVIILTNLIFLVSKCGVPTLNII
jgi:hypothetical protein